MIDLKRLREDKEALKQGALAKGFSEEPIERLWELDQEIRPAQAATEELQARRNSLSKQIGRAQAEERAALIQQVADIKADLQAKSERLNQLKAEFDQIMLTIPAPALARVPIGRTDQDNVELRQVGKKPAMEFSPLDHVELGKKWDWIDVERGVKLAGSRSYVLKGEGAQLEQAVLRYTYDRLIERGFTPMAVPVLVKEEAMVGTGYFPTGRDQAYIAEKDQMALVGTGEVPLASYHSGEILDADQLPVRMMAWTSCFRREAGTYGKDTSGLYRVHQFQKIEQVVIAPADVDISEELHYELLGNAESLLKDLGLHYRVVEVCTGDIGQGQVWKHDIETWMPSRDGFGETHSCSSFYDFQARRLNLRYRGPDGKPLHAYTLNNTAVASPRILIALLEQHQCEDRRVRVPECLQPYLGGKTHLGG